MKFSNYYQLIPFTLIALASTTLRGQALLSHYTLNGSGDDSGSLGIDGELIGDASYTEGGVGIYNQALSTADGTQDFFRADTSGNTAFDLSAITISLWVNVSALNDGDRLVSSVTSTTGFDLYLKKDNLSAGDFRLAFGFNSTSGAVQSSDNVGYQANEWVFLAVTYDSTIESGDDVFFYLGSETNAVTMNDSGVKGGATGTITTSTQDLEIGGTPATSGDRTPSALFNDVRIYNGALDMTALEAVRTAAIPEPSQFAWFAGFIAVCATIVRRRRK